MGTDGRSQIREINLSAMDVCWSNKLFLMRQFGLSQSNFVVKKVAKCIAKFIRSDILFLIMFIVYTKYFEIDIIFYWTKSLHDMKSDLISVFVDISYEIFFARLRNKRLQFTPNRYSPCAFQNQIFSLKITMNNMYVIVGFV